MSSRVSSPGPSSTPFPSRPFLHTLSPSTDANQETPPDLRRLETAWRQLRRHHVHSPLSGAKAKSNATASPEREAEQENQPPSSDTDSEDDDPARPHKVRGDLMRAQTTVRAQVALGRPPERGDPPGRVPDGQPRRPRFRTTGPSVAAPPSTSRSPPLRPDPPVGRIASVASAIFSDAGTHRTSSYTYRPPPLDSPPPIPQPKAPSVQFVEPRRAESESSVNSHPLDLVPGPSRQTVSPQASRSQAAGRGSRLPTAHDPLYTAHLPGSHQPLKHGHITIDPGFGVRLILRGQRWELSGDGQQLSYFGSIPRTSVHNTPPPIQQFTSPFPDLGNPRGDELRPSATDMNRLHRKRLVFLRSYISGVRSQAVFCSVTLPPSAFPSHTHPVPSDASVILQIHANPPHPSMTLTVTRSIDPVEAHSSETVVRWVSDGLVASKGKWEIHVAAPTTSPPGGNSATWIGVEQAALGDAGWAWDVLDGLRGRGVGGKMWEGWVGASPRTGQSAVRTPST